MASPVVEALARCRETFTEADPASLIGDLPLDAVLARARGGDVTACVPRLLELAVTGEVTRPSDAFAAVAADQDSWDPARARAVEAVLDAWWATVCRVYPFAPGVDEVLAGLACFDLPLVRWLHPWIEQFDGPGIEHLADLVLEGLHASAWADRPDARSQILGWTRTEPVVMGVALVGGTHLEHDRFSAVLDVLIDDPGRLGLDIRS